MISTNEAFQTVDLLLSDSQPNWSEDYSILTSVAEHLTSLNYCQQPPSYGLSSTSLLGQLNHCQQLKLINCSLTRTNPYN